MGYIHSKAGTKKDKYKKRLRILFDSGCGATLVNHEFLTKLKKKSSKDTTWNTKAGSFNTNSKCKISFVLPEFHENRDITANVYVDNSSNEDCKYDMIIGRDLLSALGIDLVFSEGVMLWDNAIVPMRATSWLSIHNIDLYEAHIHHMNDPLTSEAARIQSILDIKYAPADIAETISSCANLDPEEKTALKNLLNKYEDLFDGTLGKWKTAPVDIELKDPTAKPYHGRPYPVPHSQEKKLKAEIARLVEAGVLRKVNRSEWGFPAFTVPKADTTIRSIADLRELNKRIKRKPYPIPKIQDILLKLEGFQFASSLDLNMGYYHIELTPNASKLCTVIFPWGKYEYLRLPMGLCNSPDIFQEKVNELFNELEYVRAYIDDILVLLSKEGEFDEHVVQLEKVFTLLQGAGLKVNMSKSFFAKEELEYLGYWITREGVQPSAKKVEAILRIAPPKTRKQLRSFIGMVNYYRDMWIRRSHALAPLSAMCSVNVKFKWEEEHQKAFDLVKRIVAREVLLSHPDFTLPFHIHTDASKLQLGAVISQNGKPLAFYSRKLKGAQTKYNTTERELLSIVEVFKEFRTILLGQELIVHTDHQNLIYSDSISDRVTRWKMYIEEYNPNLTYIKGKDNIVADALSCLDLLDETPLEDAFFTDELCSEFYCYLQFV